MNFEKTKKNRIKKGSAPKQALVLLEKVQPQQGSSNQDAGRNWKTLRLTMEVASGIQKVTRLRTQGFPCQHDT